MGKKAQVQIHYWSITTRVKVHRYSLDGLNLNTFIMARTEVIDIQDTIYISVQRKHSIATHSFLRLLKKSRKQSFFKEKWNGSLKTLPPAKIAPHSHMSKYILIPKYVNEHILNIKFGDETLQFPL